MQMHDTGSRQHSRAHPGDIDLPSPTTSRHSKPSKIKTPKSANSVRSRPADPLLMSSMIDSLSGSAPVDKKTYYEKVDGHHHTRTRSASYGAWSTEGPAPSPSVRTSSRLAGHSPSSSLHASEDIRDADPPAISRPRKQPLRLASHDSSYQDFSRSSSLRSRELGDLRASLSRQSTLTGASKKKKHTRELAAFGPSLSLQGEETYEAVFRESQRKDRNTGIEPSAPTSRDADVEDDPSEKARDDGRTPNVLVTAGSAHALEAPVILQTDMLQTKERRRKGKSQLAEDESYFTVKGKGKQKAVASDDIPSPHSSRGSRASPADLVPTRRSSLHHSDKRSSHPLERRALRRAKSSDGGGATALEEAPEGQDALTEEVLTELGDEDQTVRRIRQLKEQKMQRMRSFRAEQTTDDSLNYPVSKSPHSNPGFANAAPPLSQGFARANSTPTPRTKIAARAPDTTKSNKLLGLNDAPSQKSKQTTNALARLDIPFDPYLESPINKPARSPDSSPERSPRHPTHDYGRVLKALDTESRTSTAVPHADGVFDKPFAVPSRENSLRDRTAAKRSTSGKRSQSAMRHPKLPGSDADSNGIRSSIDDEVETYMAHPRLNQTVRHPKTGRIISFSEVGDPNGFPVFVCVGMGLTRFVSAFYDDLASTLGLRLITPDRPGVGKSESRTGRDSEGPMSWHQDVLAICAHLDVGQFSLLAHSAGTIFALATALILPHKVTGRVYLLAPWIPPSQFETPTSTTPDSDVPATSPSTAIALPRSQRLLRVLPVSLLKAANSSFLGMNNASPKSRDKQTSTSPPGRRIPDLSLLTSDTDPDLPLPSSLLPNPPPAVLSATCAPTDPDLSYATSHLSAAQHAQSTHSTLVSQSLIHRIWSASTRDSNPATDLLVCLERHRPIGFRYEDVRKPLVVLHGSDDRRVRVENVKWLVGRIDAVRRTRAAGRRKEVPAKVEEAPRSPLDPRSHWRRDSGATNAEVGQEEDDGDDAECDLRVLPGEGHGLMASAAVMGEVLAEIAGDWRRRKDGDLMTMMIQTLKSRKLRHLDGFGFRKAQEVAFHG
ncbi:alpha/beta-hydrolase [Myriangium duriaei CBS 260.36]|uniref:Alpha/beta-hydrolase n=1 Tax=Myriangium duriaei CBS 260.36 TaxID=1168546 RepID=A0A9P4J5C0_9PEZI|nr:alpha/beta-hydrolase [Myriangium duriaei CBS 260.36]